MASLRGSFVLVFAFGLTFGGCDVSEDVPPELLLRLRTDTSVYVISDSGFVTVSAVNVSTDTLYQVLGEEHYKLEKKKGEGWQTLGPWYLTAGRPSLREIPPGDSANVPPPIDVAHNPVEGRGTYRVRTRVFANEERSRSQLRFSNSFRIR